MNSTLFIVLLLIFCIFHSDGSVCFSLPATPPGANPYTATDCGGAMPATGYPIGTQCTTPSVGCLSPSLSKATCLDGVSNNEGYWSQPVCTVSASPGFTTTQATTTTITTVANTEYAALVHLDNLYTTVSLRIGFTGGLTASSIVLNIYILQDPVGAAAGPGDLIYSVTGSIPISGSFISTDSGLEVVSTITNMPSMGGGDLLVNLPTPLNFGNDFYVSIILGTAGITIPMECTGGPNVKQYWSRNSSTDPFVSTNVAGTGYACIANVVYVLEGTDHGPSCQPTLLTSTIGYGGGGFGNADFDGNEPTMPYLDYTRSGFTGGPYLDLNFTFPTGVYDDIQFIPYAGMEAFGPAPSTILGGAGVPPCGSTFQVFKQSTSNCQTTATVRANFLQLITEHVTSNTQVCGWTLTPSPVQYQGAYYSQWTGTIQIVTYQTVALLGTFSLRIKEAYANVVVRSPIVTSNAIASPITLTDAAVFQWSIVTQQLDTDSLPYNSVTNLQTKVTAGYQLSATAVVTSGSAPTAWTFAGGLTSITLTSSSAACTGTTTACNQAWSVVVNNIDSAVCSLDAVVTITFVTACNSQLITSGGCDSNVDGRAFMASVVLSSVDFCRVVGGVTALTMSIPTVATPSTSVTASTTFLTNAAMSSFPSVPTIFVVGSSIGVYFSISSQPQVPIVITAVSAKIFDANERSHFSLYSDVTLNSDGSGAPFYFATQPSTPGSTTRAFFNLPTGDQGTGTVYTPWLLTNAGSVNNIVVSVTASVQYDNVLLHGDGPHFVTFEIPMTSTLSSTPQSLPSTSSPFRALRNSIRSQSLVTGIVSQETTTIVMQSSKFPASETTAMSTATIAGAVTGSAVLLIAIIIVVTVVVRRVSSAIRYAPPVTAAANVVAAAPLTEPIPNKDDFYAPHISNF